MSDARGKAHVHCVIIGLTRRDDEPKEKRLFSYDDIDGDPKESRHVALAPYLFDASALADRHLVVEREASSICAYPEICVGTKPVDGGHYIFDESGRARFLQQEPAASRIMRPFVGGYEHINGVARWILVPQTISAQELRRTPHVAERISKVRHYREREGGKLAKALASTPTAFHVTVLPSAPFLAIPEVSSERREYIPIGYLEPPAVPSNQILVVRDAGLFMFGILTSRMHMAWLRNIGGRLKNDYRYSSGIVYNPFPWPLFDDAAKRKLEKLAQGVLDARATHEGATLADLYDPDVMPQDLRKAHRALDEAVDLLYRKEPFASDRERVEHLFGLYEKLTAPMLAAAKPKRGRKKSRPGGASAPGCNHDRDDLQ
jgi:hypothetical protein